MGHAIEKIQEKKMFSYFWAFLLLLERTELKSQKAMGEEREKQDWESLESGLKLTEN